MKFPFVVAVSSLFISSTLQAQNSFIVDVDAKHNGGTNPIVKYLPAGEYKVTHIGPEDGGKYYARHAWSGSTYRCNYEDGTVCYRGWERATGIRSEEVSIAEATRQYRYYSDVYVCDYNYPQQIREKYNLQFATWSSPQNALAAMQAAAKVSEACIFTVGEDGFVMFHDLDGLTADNRGGTSYLIESVNKVMPVTIDIKPGSDRNPLNMNGNGVIPVAVLGSEEFDVTAINAETLTLAGLENALNGQRYPTCGVEYANEDAFPDMVCHFRDDTAKWEPSEGEAKLSGLLFDGTMIEGSDNFEIVGKGKPVK